MSSDLGVLGNRSKSTLHSQYCVKMNQQWKSQERGQQKWVPGLRRAIKLAQIA